MSSFSFTFVDDPLKITYEFKECQLDAILDNFSNFLKGCGFIFDGRLVIDEPISHNFDESSEDLPGSLWRGNICNSSDNSVIYD